MSGETIRVVGRSGCVMELPAIIANGMLRNGSVKRVEQNTQGSAEATDTAEGEATRRTPQRSRRKTTDSE